MQRVLAVMVAAAILVFAAVAVLTISGGSLTNFEKNREDTETSSKCQFQSEQYCQGNLDASDVDSECVEEGYLDDSSCDEGQLDQALAETIGPGIT